MRKQCVRDIHSASIVRLHHVHQPLDSANRDEGDMTGGTLRYSPKLLAGANFAADTGVVYEHVHAPPFLDRFLRNFLKDGEGRSHV